MCADAKYPSLSSPCILNAYIYMCMLTEGCHPHFNVSSSELGEKKSVCREATCVDIQYVVMVCRSALCLYVCVSYMRKKERKKETKERKREMGAEGLGKQQQHQTERLCS